MNTTTTKSRFFTRFVVGPIAAAGILGGAAMGLAAAANADTGPSDHPSGGYSTEYRPSHDSRDFYREFRPFFWDFWGWHHHRDHDFGWRHGS
ncbi:hypothetical protein [Mycobacterium sp. 3519A]|uniref:hypothetical protein n=1 Tax=Mycobacterium sp. 3519A TaxID=2057184 RepID=UPI000C797333|nr:hypothetical protein [Mycobacterium sp. 3519A]